MTPIPSRVSRASLVAMLLLLSAVGLGAVGCQASGSAAPSGNLIGMTPSPSIAPAASVVQTATAVPSPSAVGASTSPGAASQIAIDDPDLTMTLPVGWAAYPVSTYRFLIESVATTSSPEIKALLAAHLKAIDDGAIRVAAGGPAGSSANGSLIIQVDAGDRSLEAAVARLGQFGKIFTNASSVEERPVTLAIGNAVRRVETHPVAPDSGAGAVPARTIEYIARLEDGRTLWILATGPEAVTTFEALIDASVMTIHRR
jgi:hypothetical protein